MAFTLTYDEKLKKDIWYGYPDPDYLWDDDRLKKETKYIDENGKEQTSVSYRNPIEITANFNPDTKISLANPEISAEARKKFGGDLKGFVWLDKIAGGGEIVLPFTAPHIFKATGSKGNPTLTEINTNPAEDDYYKIIDNKTHVHVSSFSGVGGAAGAPPTLIAHYRMNEDTANDNNNQITNPSFASDTGWTKGTGWSIAGGVAHCDGSQVDPSMIYQPTGITVGRKFGIVFTISNYSGTGQIRPFCGNGRAGTWVSGNGTHTEFLVNVGNNNFILQGDADFIGDIDNVSVKLCAAEDSSGNGHDMLMQQDTDAIHVAGKINGAFDFNGTSDFGQVGDTESDVKSIVMWVNPDAVGVTDSIIDLNGTDYITIVNGTVTKNGFATGTQIIYVDGVVASIVTANWHLIILTSTVGFDANDLDIGRKGSSYFGGLIDSIMLYSVVLSPDDGKRIYNNRHGTEILAEVDEPRLLLRRNNSQFGLRSRYEK